MKTLLKVNYDSGCTFIDARDYTDELIKYLCEVISKSEKVRSVEVCLEEDEESEQKTVGERIAAKFCSDVADVTLRDKKWNVRKRDTTH